MFLKRPMKLIGPFLFISTQGRFHGELYSNNKEGLLTSIREYNRRRMRRR